MFYGVVYIVCGEVEKGGKFLTHSQLLKYGQARNLFSTSVEYLILFSEEGRF